MSKPLGEGEPVPGKELIKKIESKPTREEIINEAIQYFRESRIEAMELLTLTRSDAARNDSQFRELIDLVKSKKSEFYQLLESSSMLNIQERNMIKSQVLDAFYSKLEDPKFLRKISPGKTIERCTDVSTD